MLTDTIELQGSGNNKMTVTVFQLLQFKSALKLEMVGLTMSRGRKVSTHIKKGLGLKRSVTAEQCREIICDVLAQLPSQS